jgi:signal transduction histidine kinase
MRIRTSLIFTHSAVVALAVVLVGGITLHLSQSLLRDRILRDANGLLDRTGVRIKDQVQSAREDAGMLATVPPIPALLGALASPDRRDPASGDSVEDWTARFTTIATGLLGRRGSYWRVRLLDGTGQELAKVSREPSGTRVAALPELEDCSRQNGFRQVMQLTTMAGYVGPLELEYRDRRPVQPPRPYFQVAMPVRQADGALGLVVVIDVWGDHLFSPLRFAGESYSLVDQDGYYLYHPDPSYCFGAALGHQTRLAQHHPLLAELLPRTDHLVTDALRPDQHLHGPALEGLHRIYYADDFTRFWTIVYHLDAATAFAPLTRLRLSFALVGLGVLLLGVVLAIWRSRRLAEPLTQLARAATRLAENDPNVELPRPTRTDELETLTTAFAAVVANLRHLITQANRVAQGDYTADIQPRNERDALGAALAHMHAGLREADQHHRQDTWLKTGLTQLGDTLRGELEPAALAQQALAWLAHYLEAPVGALYLHEQGELHCRAVYGTAASALPPPRAMLGEGLLGTAARERTVRLVADAPGSYLTSSSALGSAPAAHLLVVPFVYHDELVGVLELGRFSPFAAAAPELAREIGPRLAVAFLAARARARNAALLAETQRQAADLVRQQEELRAANLELETQAQALQTSEEQLRAQQEELRASNQDLAEQAQRLDEQKTELAAAHAALQDSNQALERQATELRRANQVKSEFLASMSHELRTPLNSILLLATMLHENREGNLTPAQRDSAHVIHQSGTDLLLLINDILDLARIEAGRQQMNPAAVALAPLAESLRGMFAPLAAERQLAFAVTLDPAAPAMLETDGLRLQQILRNLVANAIKFTPAGSVTLTFGRPAPETALPAGLAREQALACIVADTGIGIAAAEVERIFEPFYQVDRGPARQHGGTGLGLAISRQLALQLGGQLTVQSVPGAGSTFTLLLPLTPPAHAAVPPVVAATAPNPAPAPVLPVLLDTSFQGRTILVVDDDMRNTFAIAHLLRGKGMIVLLAEDGQRALETLADHPETALVLLDLMLPRMDGFEVLRRLRADAATAQLPVIVLTAKAMPGDRDQCLQAGANDYLTKPFQPDKLCSLLRVWLTT